MSKLKSKKTLTSGYTKEQLADIIIMQAKNIEVLEETIDQQYINAINLYDGLLAFKENYKQHTELRKLAKKDERG